MAAVLRAMGFGASHRLHAENLAALALSPITDARVVRGPGALRALVVVLPSGESMRGSLTRIAAALASRTSHVLWVVGALTADGDEAAVATWAVGETSPRVASLCFRPSAVVASDADTLASLAAASDGADVLAHLRWCELLGREGLGRRFYRTLEQRVAALADSLVGVPRDDRAELALLLVSRLLFLSFLQAKGWLDADHAFLGRRLDACLASGGRFHHRVLQPLFFGTLNTPMRRRAPAARAFGAVPFLNGGLFARTALEKRHSRARFPDEQVGALFGELLDAYRFTARESSAEFSAAAVDPEMLGRAFEQLMSSRDRRITGAFYTPQSLVAHVADDALTSTLVARGCRDDDVGSALAGRPLAPDAAARLCSALDGLTVLDPACGSGAFLVYLLERLAVLHAAAGDARDVGAIRRAVLASAIYGVDINPTAVWLCELRLWLSVVIESDERRMARVPPLPNLDCNIRVGDALAGDAFTSPALLVGPSSRTVRLRERYIRAAGASKRPLRRALAREERCRSLAELDRRLDGVTAMRREALLARRSPDLFGAPERDRRGATAGDRELRARAAALRRERRRIEDGGALPFSFPSHFGHVHAVGGFSVVVGNPPWVRSSNIAVASRPPLRATFAVLRDPGWAPVAQDGRTRRSFGMQVDLAALFLERSLALGAPSSVIALLLPAKLWRSLAGGSVRRLVSRHRLLALEDWTDAPSLFDAAVYPSVLSVQRATPGGEVRALVMAPAEHRWTSPPAMLRLAHDEPASPWLLVPPDVRAAHQRLTDSGTALADLGIGRVTLGVKCGLNDAFVVADHDVTGRVAALDPDMCRPLLRGEGMRAWHPAASPEQILWTHAPDGRPLTTLPPSLLRRLAPWRHALSTRSDARNAPWWSLFRTEGARSTTARVVWGDFGRVPRAACLPAGHRAVPLNSCYVLPCADPLDALAVTTLLNAPPVAAWLNVIAEPARGGWRRYLAWTVSLLPLPHDWRSARIGLAHVAERALLGDVPSDEDLSRIACDAYGFTLDELEPLLAWQAAMTSSSAASRC